MKYFLVTLLCFVFSLNQSFAGGGCIPNAPTGTPGLTPPADSLPCIERTVPYRQVLYIENLDSISSSFGTVIVNFLRIDSITNLPSNMVWQANNSNNTYVGGEAGCIEIIGTTSDTVGTYQLGLYITIQVVIPLLGVQTFSGEASALIAQFETLAGGPLGIDFSYFVTVINPSDPCRPGCTPTNDTVSISICDGDSFFAGGFFQTAPGFYIDSFTNSQGCDSLITTDLAVRPTSLTLIPVSICSGDSVFAGGAFQKNPGSYFDTLTGSNGCDSIIQTDLSVIPFFSVNVLISICDGDSLFVGGAFQENPGVYYDTLTSSAGCDSIITTDLSVIQPVFSNTSVTICPGDSVFAGGAFQKTPGLYYDTLTAFSGCDSVLTTNLSLSSTLTFNVPVSICTGDSILAGGQYQTTSGVYYDTLSSPSGCDSIIITNLTVSSFIFQSVQADICDGENHFAGGVFQTVSGTYYDTFPAVAGCDSIVETILTVHANPLVSFTTLNSTYCSNQSPIPLIGNPAGGSFSGTGLVGGTFDPSIVPVGISVSITYSYTDSFGCSGSQTQFVNVLLPSSASFSSLDTQYCADDEVVALDGNPSGGTFSGPGISGSSFVPFFAGVGNHTLAYTVSSSNGCTASDSKTVTVHPLPDLSFATLDSSYCADDTILLNATPSGGAFSGAGVTDSFFLASLSGTGGPFIIEYSYTDSNGCESTTSTNIMVQPIPQLTFFGIQPGYCLGDAPVLLNATPPGGNYSGPGISGNQFIPDSAGTGSHTILYTYADTGANTCSASISKQVQVNSSPSVTFSLSDNEFCSGEPQVILSASPSGGIFSGAGVSLNVFTPDNSLAGDTPTITYEFTDLNGCTGSASVSAIVLASPDVQISGLSPVYCEDDLPASLLGLPAGGVFLGAGISGDIFEPSAAGVGTHIIFYSLTDANGCYAETNQSVIVGCTGLASLSNKLTIKIYPNPFKDEVFIHCNFGKNVVLKIRMLNIIGSEVFHEEKIIPSGKENFNLSFENNLIEGMYIIEISEGEKIFRTKLLKAD